MGFYSSNSNRIGYSTPVRNSSIQRQGVHSLRRLAQDNYVLPNSVILYCPLNDPVGTDPKKVTTYTSHVGETYGSINNRIWNHEGYNGTTNGAIISVPATHPLGYTTCWNGGGERCALTLNTPEGEELWYESIMAGTEGTYKGQSTNVSLEFFMYLGTNSNVASGWTRIINLDGFWGDGDGFEIEFYGTSDSRIFAAFSYGLTGNRDSISIDSANTDNLRTERWHYVRMCREIYYMGEFTNTRATMHIGPCTDDAGSTNTTVARVLNDTTTSHATHGYAWESLPSSGGYNSGNDDNRFLHLGQAPYTIAGSGSANSYIGGISDVVMRVMDPMAYYKNGQTDLTIPTWSQVFTNPNSPNYLGIS